MHLITLGELRLLDGAADRLRGRRKDLVLLAYLAQRSPRSVGRAELAALLWSEREESRARHSLRQALHDLRGVLGTGIEVRAANVRLAEHAVSLDVEQLAADLSAQRYALAAERWRGDFLEGLDDLGGEQFRGWLESERQRARQLMASALQALAGEAEARGEWRQAIEWLERWREVEPAGEAVCIRLLDLLRLAGRADAAAAEHARFVACLRAETGEQPSESFLLLSGAASAPGSVPAPPVRTSSAALFSPDLVGRADAFEQLVERWRQASQGSGSVVVVGGEVGIGKTRLCDEFLQWLQKSGEVLVLRARAYQAERGVAWASARDLFAGLAGARGLGGAPDVALAELSKLVPAVRARFPRLPQPTGAGDGLAPAVVQILGDVAMEQPVVVFLDDFAAADEPTRQLLLAIARRLPDRVLLLLTAVGDLDGFDAALNPLREVENVGWLALKPLTSVEVEALVASMVAVEPHERRELALRLHAEAEGNPFYTIALLSALADAGHLAPHADGIWRIDPARTAAVPMPADIRETVRARLQHLSEPARELIGAAAVIGRTVDGTLLEAVAAQPHEQFCEALDELLSRRLLRSTTVPDHGYEFSHHLVRRVAQELLSPVRRQRLHRAALHALRRLPQDNDRVQQAKQYHRHYAGFTRSEGGLRRSRAAAVGVLIMVLAVLVAWVLTEHVSPAGDTPMASIDLPVTFDVAEVTTHSLVAARFYSEGLRAFYQGDRSGAYRLFSAALREDSSFAMAAYFAGRSLHQEDFEGYARYLAWAQELAEHASEPERLLIRGTWAYLANDPARIAIAETLAIRYPTNPDGLNLLGLSLVWTGEFLRAVPYLEQVIALEATRGGEEQPRCRACEAYSALVDAYTLADSLDAAERAARAWVQRAPTSASALHALGGVLQRKDCFGEAIEVRRRAIALQPGSTPLPASAVLADCAIRRGDFGRADRLLRADADAGPLAVRRQALWFLIISLRNQGRLEEALAAAREYRASADAGVDPGSVPPYEALPMAVVLFEMGRHREAAALFDSLTWGADRAISPARAARQHTWLRTHRATALHAAGDTIELVRLAAEIENFGARSAYGRDPRLHYHARGLLWASRGRWAEAEASFQRAIFSPTEGYTRTNLELARALLRLGRPEAAVPVLRSALRGGLQASNLYVTRTELQEALAQAFEAAGQPDSAFIYYQRVTQAWSQADLVVQLRREQAIERAATLAAGGEQIAVN